jgi:hypothetical protein
MTRVQARNRLLIVLAGLLAIILLRPFQNAPFIDDWVYAWPVEHFSSTGELKILEYSGAINLPQVFWGLLFTLPGGFSFTALRISTFVLALVSLWLLHRLIRVVGGGNEAAGLGAATLGIYPIFFILSFTFMTDVPFVACMIAAAHELAFALRLRSTWRLLTCAVAISLSVSLRMNGLALAAAMGVVLLLHTGGWGRRGRFLLALVPLIVAGALMLWRKGHLLSPADVSWVPNSPTWREENLQYAIPLLPKMLPAVLSLLAGDVGIALLPLAVGVFHRQMWRRYLVLTIIIAALCIISHFLKIEFPPPLRIGETWAVDELGATRILVPGYVSLKVPPWLYWVFATVGWCSTAVVLASCWRRLAATEWFLIWSIAFTILIMAMLWLTYDRYALPIVAPLIVLALAGREWVNLRRALGVLVLYGMICFIGTRDHLAYNRALWASVKQLQELGAKDSEIVGGYPVNGWLHYAHPASAPRDESGAVMIPWVNSDNQLRYEISNSPPKKGTVLATRPYTQWMGRSGSLYLIDHEAR